MKALFIDTSDTNSLVMLLDSDNIVSKFSLADLPLKERDQMINTRIKEMLGRCATKFSDLDAYAVTTGPGSWTGIRIGVTIIKAYALAKPKPIIEIRQNSIQQKTEKELSSEVFEKFKLNDFIELKNLEPFYDGEFKVTKKKENKGETHETN